MEPISGVDLEVQNPPKKKLSIAWFIFWFITIAIIVFLSVFICKTKWTALKINVRLTKKIPITYIWIGGELPPRYKARLRWITFPYVLLTDQDWIPYEKKY